MPVHTSSDAVRSETGARSPTDHSARPAVVVFAMVLAASFVFFLVYGHDQWFYLDEWDLLANRTAGDLGDLFRLHNEHLMTLPILAYRALWSVFGLRTYVPYQLVPIVLHLTVAVLLRVVMRRAGVRPWIATSAASLFALFGAGSESIVYGIQMSWDASLALGLVHLLLADHDGPPDRRDALGLLAGFVALLCSGVAVTMVVIVGMAVAMRRGWRIAALHTVPLAMCFLAWWIALGRQDYAKTLSSIGQTLRFVWTGIGAAFDAMGQVPGAGVALAVLLIVGLFLAWRPLAWAELRRRAAVPGALLLGSVVFLIIAAVGRAAVFGPSFARTGRYLYVIAALSLPAIAIASDAIVHRWRALGPVVLVLLLIGIPGNIKTLVDRGNVLTHQGDPALTLALPHIALARRVPRELRPNPGVPYTIGWLLDGASSGRVPAPRRLTPSLIANAKLRLSLLQSEAPRLEGCKVLRQAVRHDFRKDESIGLKGGAILVRHGTGEIPVYFHSLDGQRLTANVSVDLDLIPDPNDRPELCRATE